jgi:hypothetical protein
LKEKQTSNDSQFAQCKRAVIARKRKIAQQRTHAIEEEVEALILRTKAI